jgi:putative CocE/NonD family hydrolase
VTYGIVLAKDLKVSMRDGIKLATDVYRPARDGELVSGRWPAIVCLTPYDKSERRYSEIADFFVPHGYAVVIQDLRDRHRSEGTGEYFHTAAPHTGEDGHDTIEWVARQNWSNGRTGMVGSSYAGVTQIRTALERPPHLTAIWPDVAPTNMYRHQTREGGAMQLHMFWALYIHAADAQDIQGKPAARDEVLADLRRLRELMWGWPWRKGELALRHVPALDQTLEDYCTRAAYDDYWARKSNDLARFFSEHADVPATMSSGWYDAFPHAVTEYFQAMVALGSAAQRLVMGPWSHVGMRGDASWVFDVDFGEESIWGTARCFEEQLRFFDTHLKGQPRLLDDGPIRIFVMGGGTGRRTALGKLDHGGQWRSEQEWPLARAQSTTLWLVDDALTLEAGEGTPRTFVYDPNDPVPTIGGNYCAVGELPKGGDGLEPMWMRLLNPALMLRNIMTPGPTHQQESEAFFTARLPGRRLSERSDVLVYRTEPIDEAVEVTGPIQVHLRVSSTAVDTDFTAKLIDEYPPNEDYPLGYDLLINDSIIRARFRNGFEREELLEPGCEVDVTIMLPPTSNRFGAGHRIRLDVSSSNFPRLERNPNTGEPVGRHTHTVVAENTVHGGRIVLPVIPNRKTG